MHQSNNQILNEHKQRPYHLERPLFSSVELSHKDSKVFLDINNKDIIQGLYYIVSENSSWLPYFSYLAKNIEGLNIVQARELNSSIFDCFELEGNAPLINFPLLVLNNLLDLYEGEIGGHSILVSKENDELICRCFGCYKSQIVEHCKSNPKADLSSVSGDLMAGAGCSSCQKDIKKIIASELGQTETGKSIFINGYTPVDFLIKLDELFTKHSSVLNCDIEIIDLDCYHLTLKTDCADKEYLSEKLNQIVFDNLKAKLSFLFL